MASNDSNEVDMTAIAFFNHIAEGSIEIYSYEPIFSAGIANTQEFSWRIDGYVEAQLESSWKVGGGEYYWYRIEGECTPVQCETMGVENPKCNMTFSTVVAGRNLAEVCENMKTPVYNAPVLTRVVSIKRYSRPVLKVGNSYECNILEDEYFCQVPECQDYCVHENVKENIPLKFIVFDTIYYSAMSGGISLSGRAEGSSRLNFVSQYPIVYFGGGCEVVVRYSYDSSTLGTLSVGALSVDQIEIEGAADFSSSRYDFIADGEVSLSGWSEFVSPNWNYEPTITHFILAESGQELLTEDEIEIGVSVLASSGFELVSIGGSAHLGYHFQATGYLELDGVSDKLISLKHEPTVSDPIRISGTSSDVIAPSYIYVTSGIISLDGEANLGFEDLGLVLMNIKIATTAFGFEYNRDSVDQASFTSGEALTISNSVVNTSCGCSPTGLSLALTHNLLNSSMLANFLRRNGLDMSDRINLGYRSHDSSWRYSEKLSGASSSENMIMFFSFSCMVNYWKFSFSARNQDENGNLTETKLIMDIPSSFVCLKGGNISADISVDIYSGEIITSAGEQFYVVTPHSIRPSAKTPYRGLDVTVGGEPNSYTVYYDDIGLFKNSYWDRVPLRFGLNPNPRIEMTTMNLQSIF